MANLYIESATALSDMTEVLLLKTYLEYGTCTKAD